MAKPITAHKAIRRCAKSEAAIPPPIPQPVLLPRCTGGSCLIAVRTASVSLVNNGEVRGRTYGGTGTGPNRWHQLGFGSPQNRATGSAYDALADDSRTVGRERRCASYALQPYRVRGIDRALMSYHDTPDPKETGHIDSISRRGRHAPFHAGYQCLRCRLQRQRCPRRDPGSIDAVPGCGRRERMGCASPTLSGNRTRDELSNIPFTVFGMIGGFMKYIDLFALEDACGWVAGLDATSYTKAFVGSQRAGNGSLVS
jgi:hypothetical protein